MHTVSADTLPLATGEWPPFTSEHLEGKGFYTHFISEVVKEMGMEPKVIFVPWSRAALMLSTGKVFGTFPYAITAERKEEFNFSNVINYTTTVFFYSKKHIKHEIKFNSLNDLKPYRIAVMRGNKSTNDLAKFSLILDTVNSDEQSIVLLNHGRAQLSPINEFVGWFIIKKTLPNEVSNFGTLPKPLHTVATALMISRKYKDTDQLRELFNQALIRVNKKDIYKKLLKKYDLKKGI